MSQTTPNPKHSRSSMEMGKGAAVGAAAGAGEDPGEATSSDLDAPRRARAPHRNAMYMNQLQIKRVMYSAELWVVRRLRCLVQLLLRLGACFSIALALISLGFVAGGIYAVNELNHNDVYTSDDFDVVATGSVGEIRCASAVGHYIHEGWRDTGAHAPGHTPSDSASTEHVSASGGASAAHLDSSTQTAMVVALSAQLPFTLIVRGALQSGRIKAESGLLLRGFLLAFLKSFEAIFRNNRLIPYSAYNVTGVTVPVAVAPNVTEQRPFDCPTEGTFTLGPSLPGGLPSLVPVVVASGALYLTLLVTLLRPDTSGSDDTLLWPRCSSKRTRSWWQRRPLRALFLLLLTALFLFSFCAFTGVVYAHNVQRDASTTLHALRAAVQYSVADLDVLFSRNGHLREVPWSPYRLMRWAANIETLLDVLQMLSSRLRRSLNEADRRDNEDAGPTSFRGKVFGSWEPDKLLDTLHYAIRAPLYALEVLAVGLTRRVSKTVAVVSFLVSHVSFCVVFTLFIFVAGAFSVQTVAAGHGIFHVAGAYDVGLTTTPSPFHTNSSTPNATHSLTPAERCAADLVAAFVAPGSSSPAPHSNDTSAASVAHPWADDPMLLAANGTGSSLSVQPSSLDTFTGISTAILFVAASAVALIFIRYYLHAAVQRRASHGGWRARVAHFLLVPCWALCCAYLRNMWYVERGPDCSGYILAEAASPGIRAAQVSLLVICAIYFFVMECCLTTKFADQEEGRVELFALRRLPESAYWPCMAYFVPGLLAALIAGVAVPVLAITLVRLANPDLLGMLAPFDRFLQLTVLDNATPWHMLHAETFSLATVFRFACSTAFVIDLIAVAAFLLTDVASIRINPDSDEDEDAPYVWLSS